MHLNFALVFTLFSMHQSDFCFGDKVPATNLPQFVEAKYSSDGIADRTARLLDPLARELRIEAAKQEILRKLGMTKRPPKMNNLRANIPKPVFDGELGSMFLNGDDEEPTKTTQVVIPATEGLIFTFLFCYYCLELFIWLNSRYHIDNRTYTQGLSVAPETCIEI